MTRPSPKVAWPHFNEDASIAWTEIIDAAEFKRRKLEAKQKHEAKYRRLAGQVGLAIELALNKRAREIFEHDDDAEREALEDNLIDALMKGKAWSSAANKLEREKAERRRAHWQSAADDIWKRRPSMTKSAVARAILALPDLPADMRKGVQVIRKAIQKK
jgi:hypothetical protein